MGVRKKKYTPKKFESSKGVGDVSANIYASMMQSIKWQQLTTRQRVLYIYMKLQYYGAKAIDGQPVEAFYFNKSMWKQMYKLYKNSNYFYEDRNALIESGFIEIIECGKTTRTKNIYIFSDRWANGN